MPAWPSPDPDRIAAITAAGPTLAGLMAMSPVRGADLLQDADAAIDLLFPAGALLCAGWSRRKFATRPRAGWRGELSSMPLMVPSPMVSLWGRTQDGRRSQHTLAATGPRRFLVVEFDGVAPDSQAALVFHLGTLAPLVAVLHSGGKSLHAWFPCAGVAEAHTERFFRHAVALGADPATWGRSQFVRVPNGRREDGRPQPILFLDPANLSEAK